MSHLSMMLSPRHPHHFPLDGALDVIAVTGRGDEILGILLRATTDRRPLRAGARKRRETAA